MLYYPNEPRWTQANKPMSKRNLKKAMCPCLCHDMNGAGHPGQRCACNGGSAVL